MSRSVFCSVSVPVLVATLILSPTAARAQQTPGQIAMFGSDTSLVDSGITENPISGNIGVGTTNPLGQLHVKGDDPVRILGDVSTLSGSECRFHGKKLSIWQRYWRDEDTEGPAQW